MHGHRVLVCGGRDYDDGIRVMQVLDGIHDSTHISVLITGGCPTGADHEARHWACARGVPMITEPADWEKYGRAAGPIRNQKMLDEYAPTMVVAFPGGYGTADMVSRARLKRDVAMVEVDR